MSVEYRTELWQFVRAFGWMPTGNYLYIQIPQAISKTRWTWIARVRFPFLHWWGHANTNIVLFFGRRYTGYSIHFYGLYYSTTAQYRVDFYVSRSWSSGYYKVISYYMNLDEVYNKIHDYAIEYDADTGNMDVYFDGQKVGSGTITNKPIVAYTGTSAYSHCTVNSYNNKYFREDVFFHAFYPSVKGEDWHKRYALKNYPLEDAISYFSKWRTGYNGDSKKIWNEGSDKRIYGELVGNATILKEYVKVL